MDIKNGKTELNVNTKQIKAFIIQCTLKGCGPCPHISCDGYHRQCEIWKNHSGR